MEMNTHMNDIEQLPRHKSQKSREHYTVPQGYFEGLTAQIMQQIPEQEEAEPQRTISWWTKARPSLYVAASLVGLFFCFKGLTYVKEQINTSGEEQAQTEIQQPNDADYIRYYEDYASRLVDHEEVRELDITQYTY